MAQTDVLPPDTAAGDSAEFVVTTPVNVVMYAGVDTNGKILERVKMEILEKIGEDTYQPLYAKQTNWAYRTPVYLFNTQRSYYLENPGTYIVRKSTTVNDVGAFVEDQT